MPTMLFTSQFQQRTRSINASLKKRLSMRKDEKHDLFESELRGFFTQDLDKYIDDVTVLLNDVGNLCGFDDIRQTTFDDLKSTELLKTFTFLYRVTLT